MLGGALEEVLAALRSISAQCNASFIRSVHGNSAQATPGRAVDKVGSEGLAIESRGSDGHVCSAPCNVGQSSMAHIARREALDVVVDARGALAITSIATSDCNDTIASEARTIQLLLDGPADIRTLLLKRGNAVCLRAQSGDESEAM